ncbi:hypothetical protein IQ259_07365 [Fortiea sp. LEGE XX443]|uniref:hypothetical protein n=1 Tax=Fortiea sp. LEGE XX443 TaxID=1828611 RepID=UPI00187EA86A|nr:hypothetical protein [Fortiea sp. LEGE XX443]MBE9004857.1 hypothetical protein [Fortiea sp. LEGE XX443]
MKKIEHSDNSSILRASSLSQSAIIPLQPQKEKMISGWERLVAQAQTINQMAAELETEILELKAIASAINSQTNYLQGNAKSRKNVCKYLAVSIPWVKRKSDESFILTTRKVDLFRAEREAASLAQKLRQQSKSKRLAAQRHRNNQGKADADTNSFFLGVLINKS